jgi:hypothetical protein
MHASSSWVLRIIVFVLLAAVAAWGGLAGG